MIAWVWASNSVSTPRLFVMTILSDHSVLSDIDPLALLIVPIVVCAADGLAMRAIGASLKGLRMRFRNFFLGLVGIGE